MKRPLALLAILLAAAVLVGQVKAESPARFARQFKHGYNLWVASNSGTTDISEIGCRRKTTKLFACWYVTVNVATNTYYCFTGAVITVGFVVRNAGHPSPRCFVA